MDDREHKKLIQRYYAARARDYDRQKRRTWKSRGGFGAEIVDEVIEALERDENHLILEVGVGSGRNAVHVMVETKSRFVGLDLSREMLSLAKRKLSRFRPNIDLILGDGEWLPFTEEAFDVIMCISTMHYFRSQAKIVTRFAELLKKKGVLTYGDLTLGEYDGNRFFDRLEKTISKTHSGYYKPSEIAEMLEAAGFRVTKTRTVAYGKSFRALMEDKGDYFGVDKLALDDFLRKASENAKRQYLITCSGLTQFYTVIRGRRGNW